MATVTVYTSTRMKQIEDETVVDGVVIGDNLYLQTREGVQIDAGNVRGPQGIQGPVGEVSDAELTAAIDAAKTSVKNDLPWGYVARSVITTGSAAFGAAMADVAGLGITFTSPGGRMYIVEFCGMIVSTVANDRIDVAITDGANTELWKATNFIRAISDFKTVYFATDVLTPAAGNVTYKIRAARPSGTGSCTLSANASVPNYIRVLDVTPKA